MLPQSAAQLNAAIRTRLTATGVPLSTRTEPIVLSLHATIQISNIPWDISTEQVVEFLDFPLPAYSVNCAPVHYVFDRIAGKTQSDLFVECTHLEAQRIAHRISGKLLVSRVVEAQVCSSRRMLDAVFPRAKHGTWITKEELQNILMHAKALKSPYTRKCPQRPFESFISVLTLFPWANESAYIVSQVDLLCVAYVQLVAILIKHIRRGKTPGLDNRLLQRLVLAGTCLTCFSTLQKQQVCLLASINPIALAALQLSAFKPIWIQRAQQAGIVVKTA